MNNHALDDHHRRRGLLTAAAALAVLATGCKTAPDSKPAPAATSDSAPAGEPTARMPPAQASTPARSSAAGTPRAYRRDGAAHLYSHNADRIYKGRMPPLLYAVGVMNVEIDSGGRVTRLDWVRAPKHAPEVLAEIERTIRRAAPFPAPSRIGKVVYTDTWLWHKSGKFQLDTLTEGQD